MSETLHDFEDGNGPVPAHRHANPDGTVGGWVAHTAVVMPGVHVDRLSVVYGNAVIFGTCGIYGRSRIGGTATLGGTEEFLDVTIVKDECFTINWKV